MSSHVYVKAAAEDAVLVNITKRLFMEFSTYRLYGDVINCHGRGDLDKKIARWNNAAKNWKESSAPMLFFILRDMDSLAHPQDPNHCPQTKIMALLNNETKHPNLFLRLTVAEGENWLLADNDNLRQFLGVKSQLRPAPDNTLHGKEALLNIARHSRKKKIRQGLLPQGEATVGKLYNAIIEDFVMNHWQPIIAAKHSKSLARTIARLQAGC